MPMPALLLFIVCSLLGGLGGALGSMVGHAAGPTGLWVGGVIGGLLGAVAGAVVARHRGWISAPQLPSTALGAALGFLAAALIAVNTLGSPVGPVLSTALIGLGALLGAVWPRDATIPVRSDMRPLASVASRASSRDARLRSTRVARIALALIALAAPVPPRPAFAQIARGTVREDLTLQSDILGHEVRYSVYLPAGYATSRRSYPVVYLLHGGGGGHRSWGLLKAYSTADEAIADGGIPPMILVMPAAGSSRYLNSHDGAVRYEDFFFAEFIPAIEAAYRVERGRAGRAVGGFSMGGYAALFYALRHPDAFSAAVALSAAVYTDSMTIAMTPEAWDAGRGTAFGTGLTGAARINATYRAYDPLRLAQAIDPAQVRGLGLYLDCGDDDPRNEGNAALHVLLRRRGIAHEYRVRDGGHTPEYWITGLRAGLEFAGRRFRGLP